MQMLIWLRYADEMERGHQSSFSLESMGSATPSAPSLLVLRPSWPQALAHGIWPAALALFLSVSTSILIFPFFPYVPTSGYFGDALPQVCSLATLPQPSSLHLSCFATHTACTSRQHPSVLLSSSVFALSFDKSQSCLAEWFLCDTATLCGF